MARKDKLISNATRNLIQLGVVDKDNRKKTEKEIKLFRMTDMEINDATSYATFLVDLVRELCSNKDDIRQTCNIISKVGEENYSPKVGFKNLNRLAA